jgi:hypothetical protein
MSNDMTHRRGARTWFARPVQVAALCFVAASGAAAQSTKARPHCVPVGGSVITNFVSADTTLGPVTGDLGGSVSAKVLGIEPGPDGTTVLTVQHSWVTEAGDTVLMDKAEATAVQVSPGLFAIVHYPVVISGGTGRFDGATGRIETIGEVDTNTGRTALRYQGTVCFKAPAR